MKSDVEPAELNVVTGAFGYTGKYITRRLLAAGQRVKTITGHPDRPNPFGSELSIVPFSFDQPEGLALALQGVTTLYNTYWVRFPHGSVSFDVAIQNTRTLIKAAELAGVRRMVNVSITNASVESPLPYFKGKGLVEEAIRESRLSYAILRPTVIFGAEDILINNIAWLLRRFPVFAILGAGDYRLQPIYVEDLADMAVRAGQMAENLVIDAVGPEVFTFEELVWLLAAKVGSRSRIVHLAPQMALTLSRFIGYFVRDVVLTRDEMEGLMANLLISQGPPTGTTRLTDWLDANAAMLGTRYASELDRHYR
ncbi:MAG: SDR family oxidoreductase [Chloroflexota bacterium]